MVMFGFGFDRRPTFGEVAARPIRKRCVQQVTCEVHTFDQWKCPRVLAIINDEHIDSPVLWYFPVADLHYPFHERVVENLESLGAHCRPDLQQRHRQRT